MGSAMIKKLPRKLLFSAAALAMAACNFGLAAYSKKSEEAQAGWIPIVLISIFYVSSSIGVIPIVELLPSEMFPTDIRTLSTGITLGSGIGMAAVATKLFPQMLAEYHVFYCLGGGLCSFRKMKGCLWSKLSTTMHLDDFCYLYKQHENIGTHSFCPGL